MTAGFSVVKLADFGLGKTFETSSEYLQDSRPAGARVYMAPEFFFRKPEYKQSVDIWAFGCVVFELLHFKRLFAGFSRQEREAFDENCPAELKQLVTDCTKLKPNERLTTSEVVTQITKIRDSITGAIG